MSPSISDGFNAYYVNVQVDECKIYFGDPTLCTTDAAASHINSQFLTNKQWAVSKITSVLVYTFEPESKFVRPS